MPIKLGPICPGHPGKLALIAGYFHEVHALCGDGGDGFTGVLEPHGEQIFDSDYVWDSAPASGNTGNSIMDIAVWSSSEASELFILKSNEIWQLPVPTCHARSALHLTLATWSLPGDPSKALAVHGESKGDTSWGAISAAGTAGLRVVH